MKIPDYSQPLIGWRKWGVGGDGRLMAITILTTWTPYEAMIGAHAPDWGFDGQCVGFDNCACGVYAFRDEEVARAKLAPRDDLWGVGNATTNYVIGTVALWGTVAVHKHGYRAEFGYPTSIVYAADGVDGRKVAETYGIPYQEDLSWKLARESAPSSWNRLGIQSPLATFALMSTTRGPSSWNQMWYRDASPFLSIPDDWQSDIIVNPDEHEFIVKPETVETPKYPGLPKGMVVPELKPPKGWYRSNGIYQKAQADDSLLTPIIDADWMVGLDSGEVSDAAVLTNFTSAPPKFVYRFYGLSIPIRISHGPIVMNFS